VIIATVADPEFYNGGRTGEGVWRGGCATPQKGLGRGLSPLSRKK